MPPPNFKVIIVGTSMEGLTLAHCLYRAGLDYLLLEKQNGFSPRKDEVTIIMPDGARILDQLGLLDHMEELLQPIEEAYLAYGNTEVYEVNFPEVLRERFGYTPSFVRKLKLVETLYNHLPRNDKVRFNKSVARIEGGTKCMRVMTWDGYWYEGDLVVGADGVHSKVRAEMVRLSNLPELAMDINRVVFADMTIEYARISGVSTHHPIRSTNTMIIHCRQGRTAICLTEKDQRMSWSIYVKTQRRFAYGRAPEFSAKEAKQQCEGLLDDNILQNMSRSQGWEHRRTADMKPMELGLLRRWHWRRILCIGNGMHKMAPSTLKDVGCSIEDAAELTNFLHKFLQGRAEKPSMEEMDGVLTKYNERRLQRILPIFREAKQAMEYMTFSGLLNRVIAQYYLPKRGHLFANWASKHVAGGAMLDFVPYPRRARLEWSDFRSEENTVLSISRLITGVVILLLLILLGTNILSGLDYTRWLRLIYRL